MQEYGTILLGALVTIFAVVGFSVLIHVYNTEIGHKGEEYICNENNAIISSLDMPVGTGGIFGGVTCFYNTDKGIINSPCGKTNGDRINLGMNCSWVKV